MEPHAAIPGVYYSGGRGHEFRLNAASLQEFAACLEAAANTRSPLSVSIGEGRMRFRFHPNPAGSLDAVALEKGTLVLFTNVSDVLQLAHKLRGMADETRDRTQQIDHLHLEPWFMASSEDISDIVIERADAVKNLETPVPSAQAARRSLVLAALVCRADIENSAGQPEVEALYNRVLAWMGASNLWQEAEPNEERILRAPLGGLDPQDALQTGWRVEGLAVLAWALRCFDFPQHDQKVNPYEVAEAIDFLSDDAEEWVGAANLRSPVELEACREFLYDVHVRLRAFLRNRSRMDFTHWIENEGLDALGLTPAPLIAENDLAVDGRPLEEAGEERLQICERITAERHRAAIWLLGEYPIYSELPVDT